MKNPPIAIAVGALFVTAVLAANYVTTEYGLVPVFPDLGLGVGLTATAGTYLAGLTFVLRDTLQDAAGKRAAVRAVLVVIAIGAALSYAVADPFIATASVVAFTTAELADLAVYTPLRRRGYVRAAIASNVVGAVIDTLLFLWIAGFGLAGQTVAGQLVGKLAVTALVVAVAAIRRRPVTA